MQIRDVRVHVLEKPLRATMRISRGGFQVRRHAIVEVRTDEGVSGLGEGVGHPELVRAMVCGGMAEQVVGLDPFDTELIRSRLLDSGVYFERMGSAVCAASAIEMACWDIKGKALGLPVYQLLGGRLRSEIDSYASDIYWEDAPERMAENARRIVALGYKTIKVHVGVRPPREELLRLAAVREAIGEDVGLMVDLNAGYSVAEALQAVDLWHDLNLYWLEEPVDPNCEDAMKRVRDASAIPIAMGENEYRVFGFRRLLCSLCADVLMPDIGRAGGLQEVRDICALASSFGVSVSPHNFSSGILLAATVHLMASTSGVTLLELDTSGNAFYDELLTWDFDLVDVRLSVPECTGLGVALTDDILRYSVG